MRYAILMLLIMPPIVGGCALNEATLSGHDFLDEALDNVAAGVEEYHGDDAERMAQARTKIAQAFAADVVDAAATGDRQAVADKTGQFVELLAKADQAEDIERQRYDRMMASIEQARDVNASLRDITQVRLGWNDELATYVNQLRKKVNNAD